MDEEVQLVVDEALYLQAVKTLSEAEDRGDKFELLNVINDYVDADYLAAEFEYRTGEEIGDDVKRAVAIYVAAVYLVNHHRASLGDIDWIRDEFAGESLVFIRAAAWAFINAWTHRYGGLYQQRVVDGRGTFIDPDVN